MESQADTLEQKHHEFAKALLEHVRSEIERGAGGDEDTLFAMRRYIHARLNQDEHRGGRRDRLRRRVFDRQQGRCAECGEAFKEIAHMHLDRTGPGGYREENVRLVHPHCLWLGSSHPWRQDCHAL